MKQEKRRRMRKLGAGPGRRQALDIPHYKTLAGNFAVPPSNSRRHSGAGLATAFLGKLAGSSKGRSLPDTSHNGAGMRAASGMACHAILKLDKPELECPGGNVHQRDVVFHRAEQRPAV